MIDINKYINEKLDLDIWDYYYVDDNTFVEYITLTDEFIKIFDEYITQEDLETGIDFYVEYWMDDNTFHYFLSFENDNVQVTDILKNIFPNEKDSQTCFDIINNQVLRFHKYKG